jgi:hypothetical protein
MGDDVHITKKENWSDEHGPAISLEEWIELVESDPEMGLDGFAEAATNDGRILRIKMAGLSVWTAYSKNGQEGNQAWFGLWGGNVVVKNPDSEIRRKMYALARILSAKVQGDEGEIYGPDGNPSSHSARRFVPFARFRR